MGDTLKALGKYGSEKPEELKPLPIGSEGYAAAGSTLFYAGPYYTQIVSTRTTAKFAAFALELAKRIAAKQAPKPEAAVARPPSPPKMSPTEGDRGGKAKAMDEAADQGDEPRGALRPAPRGAGQGGAEVRRAGCLRL